jgi:hypothetical protein
MTGNDGRIGGGVAAALTDRIAALMRDVAGELVLEPQFLFLESVEKVFVGMGPVLFFLDQGMKSGVLGLQFLDHCLVHWCQSFR